MCFANMPSTNHHYLTFTRILDPAGFHPGALCGANRPVLEWAISHVVWGGVPIICDRVRFFTETYLNRRIVPRVIWLQKNNMQDGHDGQSNLKFTIFQNHFIPKHWPLDLFGGHWKMQKHSEKKTFFKPGDGNVVCLCCVPTRLKTAHFLKKHGSCVVVLVVLPHAFSQINGCKTKKYMFWGGDIAYLAYIAKCAVSGLSGLS